MELARWQSFRDFIARQDVIGAVAGIMGVWITFAPITTDIAKWSVSLAFVALAAAMIRSNIIQERSLDKRMDERFDRVIPFFDETVETLAHEMNGFLWERRAMAPRIQSTSYPSGVTRIDPNPPGTTEHDFVTCRQFFERFNARIREDVDELARRGFPDGELDEWSRNYLSRPQILDGIVGKLGELSRRSKLSRLR